MNTLTWGDWCTDLVCEVSLGCSHYFYTKLCSEVTSGGELCHLGTSKLISNKSMNWSLHDRVFIGRSFRDYATSLVRAGKVY